MEDFKEKTYNSRPDPNFYKNEKIGLSKDRKKTYWVNMGGKTKQYYLKKIPANLFSVILLFTMIVVPTLGIADAEKIFKENNKAVVVVIAYDGTGKAISQGSGFIVRRDGVIVTNYHVISNAKRIKIKAGNKAFDVDGIINLDKENDIAILKANANNLPVVKLGDLEKIGIGEKIYVISSPKGLENTLSDGILSGKREIAPNRIILQITAPISSGSSGGPVFNKNGQVIGVATFLLKESQNLNFAMPVDVIKNKITGKKVAAIKESQIEDYEKTTVYWFNLGVAYYSSGLYREALESYKQAIRIEPDFAEAHYNLGFTYKRLDKHGEAMEAFKQAIQIKPDFFDAYTQLGVLYSESRMNWEAIEAFKQAIRIKPNIAMAHYLLGMVYLRLNDRNGALGEYNILKDLDPKSAENLFNLIYK